MKGLRNFTLLSLLTSALAQVAPTVRYMPFGDSITEIVCWRGLIYTQLQAAGYKNVKFVGSNNDQNPSGCATTNYDEHNEGHSGYLAIDIANKKQLVTWLKNNPADVITMHLGTNDIVQQNKPVADILTAFSTLIDVMRASNPNMKIIVAQIIPIGIGSSNTQIQALNKAIPAWATSKNSTASPIWVVDQYTGFPTSDLRDGVHPNAAGDALMAGKWFPALVNAINLAANATTVPTKREVEFSA